MVCLLGVGCGLAFDFLDCSLNLADAPKKNAAIHFNIYLDIVVSYYQANIAP